VRALTSLLSRDLVLATRIGGGAALAVIFFAVAITLVPFGVGPESKLLARIAPGMLWITLTLAALLSLDRMFQADFEDGSLDLILLAPHPFELTVLMKVLAHWLTTAVPLIVAAPVLGLLMNLPSAAYAPLLLSLLLGTPALSLIGAVGAALTVGMRRGGLLLSLLALPLYVPTLIFGVGAVERTLASGTLVTGDILLLAAVSLVALAISPFAAAAGIRLNLS